MNEAFYKKKINIFFLMFIACFLWGSAIPCVKLGYKYLEIDNKDIYSMLMFAGIRYIITGALLLIFELLRGNKKTFYLNRETSLSVFLNSLFQVVGQYLFYYIGIATTAGTITSILTSTTVFMSIFLSAFLFRSEKYNFKKAFSSILAVFSVLILNFSTGTKFSFRLTSEGFILFSAFCSAFAMCMQRKLTHNISPSLLCAHSFFYGGILFFAIAIIKGGRIYIDSRLDVLILLYLSFVSAIAFSIQSTLLKYNDVSSVSIFRTMTPCMGVILSSIILDGEKSVLFRSRTLLSLLLMVCAILILSLNKKK